MSALGKPHGTAVTVPIRVVNRVYCLPSCRQRSTSHTYVPGKEQSVLYHF
jgi:hypothetical protein